MNSSRSQTALAHLGTAVPHIPLAVRAYQSIDSAEFGRMDDAGTYDRRQERDGWVVLDYPRTAFIKGPRGFCFAMSIHPTDPSIYFVRS